jgi:hypothetical protein
MILSHKYKFIYIKNKRVAGTSIELALSEHCGVDDIIPPTSDEHLRPKNVKLRNYIKNGKRIFYNHMTAQSIKELVGDDIWNSYFKFCFERNPWDKVISGYYVHKARGLNQNLSVFIRSKRARDLYLSDFSNRYTIDGKVVVDFIGKYENLKRDLAFVCRRLRIPELTLPKAKTGFRKDNRHYKEIMSTADIEFIANLCAKEIKYLGY